MMEKYKKRNCNIKFNLSFTEYDGSQSCDFSINGENHNFWLSYALGDLFGSLLDCVYGLCIEVLDDRENPHIKYEDNDPARENVITRIISSTYWDGEGPSLEWTLSRELDNNMDYIRFNGTDDLKPLVQKIMEYNNTIFPEQPRDTGIGELRIIEGIIKE